VIETSVGRGSGRKDAMARRTGAGKKAKAEEVIKVPLVLTPQPEGGFTVTSPLIPELLTEGDTIDHALENVRDALRAAMELYEDLGKPLPSNLLQDTKSDPIWFEFLVAGR
jgi:antitoxin HicB